MFSFNLLPEVVYPMNRLTYHNICRFADTASDV